MEIKVWMEEGRRWKRVGDRDGDRDGDEDGDRWNGLGGRGRGRWKVVGGGRKGMG